MIAFDRMEVVHEPFPVGLIHPAFENGLFERMQQSFPLPSDCVQMPHHGRKWSLSPVLDRRAYQEYIGKHPVWLDFSRHLNSTAFLGSLLDGLLRWNVDLGLSSQLNAIDGLRTDREMAFRRTFDNILSRASRGRVRANPLPLRTRFEFSMMPADGGCILPHTDAPGKLITLVVAMNSDAEWNAEWGGGTAIQKMTDPAREFNRMNRRVEFSEVATVRTHALRANQCLLFIKTHNSLHSVEPIAGPPDVYRKTLTVNIEAR